MADVNLYDPTILNKLKLTDWPKTSFPASVSVTSPGDGLRTRQLKRNDYEKGFLQVLAQLNEVGEISEKEFQVVFDKIRATRDTYYVTVIEDMNTNEIIGSATLQMEQKFIHKCAKRGRIENVVVSHEYRGKQLGKMYKYISKPNTTNNTRGFVEASELLQDLTRLQQRNNSILCKSWFCQRAK